MKLKPYPNYKDSGVEWLADVPADWNVVSIKWISPVQRGASPRPIDDQKYFDEDGEYAWVSVKIYPNELFVSIAGTVGKPCISAIKACIHDGFVYFPKLNIPAIFLYRIFEAGTCYGGLGKFGTQLNLNTDTIGSIRIALPPKGEINNIIEFLDREIGKLDTLIAKQEQLIELLQEKRQAIISHAVTKGLNPSAKMKDSSVEWLGMVPEGWAPLPIKLVISTRKGVAFKVEDFREDGVMVAKASDIKNLTIQKSTVYLPNEFVSLYPKAVLKTGDIILSTVGSTPNVVNSAVGQIARLPANLDGCMLNQNTVVFTPDSTRLTNEYLFFLVRTRRYREHLNLNAHGTANQASLNVQDMLDIYFAIPSINEQMQITDYLDKETFKIDTLIDKAKRSIGLAKEHRTALISAAVTGKIDVREAV